MDPALPAVGLVCLVGGGGTHARAQAARNDSMNLVDVRLRVIFEGYLAMSSSLHGTQHVT
jgi:hypothetical protein